MGAQRLVCLHVRSSMREAWQLDALHACILACCHDKLKTMLHGAASLCWGHGSMHQALLCLLLAPDLTEA